MPSRRSTPLSAAQGRRLALFAKTSMCKFHTVGKCKRGDACVFAHSEAELRDLPDFSRTRLCISLIETGSCNDPECKFAHASEELRPNVAKAAREQSRAEGATTAVAEAAKSPIQGGVDVRADKGNEKALRRRPCDLGYAYQDPMAMMAPMPPQPSGAARAPMPAQGEVGMPAVLVMSRAAIGEAAGGIWGSAPSVSRGVTMMQIPVRSSAPTPPGNPLVAVSVPFSGWVPTTRDTRTPESWDSLGRVPSQDLGKEVPFSRLTTADVDQRTDQDTPLCKTLTLEEDSDDDCIFDDLDDDWKESTRWRRAVTDGLLLEERSHFGKEEASKASRSWPESAIKNTFIHLPANGEGSVKLRRILSDGDLPRLS